MLGVLLTVLPSFLAQGYPPEEALRRMKVAEGLEVQLVASEPMVRQPVAIEFDDRGRIWVVQYLQYPNPAGLKRVKVDRYSRTVYERIPEPPPRGPRGEDRITILLDLDADGRADSAKDFVEGLNLASGIAFGNGGVYVIQAPYLLFYADRDRDDVPDGDPEALLEGFGMEDASSVANSLTWGPDGWLYGAQGSTVTAHIRGSTFQQGVWRYHPATRRFELFHEGGGNTWGLDFDAHGQLFASTNVGGYAVLHGEQGGCYWKQFEKHGPLQDPFAFGWLEHAPHDGFRGGHVTAGGIVYDGASLPPDFRGKYIAANTLSHTIYQHVLEPAGSTFKARQGGEVLVTDDTWFAPCDVTQGPDGAIYVADWYDRRTAHPDPDAEWDRTNGRIYRIAATGTIPVKNLDLTRLTSTELVAMLSHPDGWHVRRARRLLQERNDSAVAPALRAMALGEAGGRAALEAACVLHACGGLDAAFAGELLHHSDADIRRWTVRFLGDAREAPRSLEPVLLAIARTDPCAAVRAQLSASARRLSAEVSVPVLEALSHRDEDVSDLHIPLLIWWGIKEKAISDRDRVLDLFVRPESWSAPLLREHILPRLARRYAAEASSEGLEACARILASRPESEGWRSLIAAIDAGLEGRRVPESPRSLLDPLELLWKGAREAVLLRVLVRLGSLEGIDAAHSAASDTGAGDDLRAAAFGVLAERGDPALVPAALAALDAKGAEPVALAALDALGRFDDDRVPGALLERYPGWSERLRARARGVLLARKAWTRQLLEAVEGGRIAAADVPAGEVRRIASHEDAELDRLARKIWGSFQTATPEEKLADVRRFHNDLRAARGDPEKGRELFTRHCGSCHRLFGEGKELGPDLTTANRGDTDFLLVSIVDPGAQVRKEYLSYAVVTKDGRVLVGLISRQDVEAIEVLTAAGETVRVSREAIASIEEPPVSLMPEGLLTPLTPVELRDLFAYMQGEGQNARGAAGR